MRGDGEIDEVKWQVCPEAELAGGDTCEDLGGCDCGPGLVKKRGGQGTEAGDGAVRSGRRRKSLCLLGSCVSPELQ